MWSLVSIFIMLFLVDCNHRMLDSPPSAVGVIFNQYKLVTSVDKTPDHYMIVAYDNNQVMLGNKLAQRQVAKAPSADFYACPDRYYTLMLIGPNPPTNHCLPNTHQLYWLGINILGDNLASGHWVASYVAPTPQANGAHYTFLVFRQQKGKQNINLFLDSGYAVNRTCFNVGKFARKWNLYLLAGNFFNLE